MPIQDSTPAVKLDDLSDEEFRLGSTVMVTKRTGSTLTGKLVDFWTPDESDSGDYELIIADDCGMLLLFYPSDLLAIESVTL